MGQFLCIKPIAVSNEVCSSPYSECVMALTLLIYTILFFLFTETKDSVKQNRRAIVNITRSIEVPGIDCYRMHLTCTMFSIN